MPFQPGKPKTGGRKKGVGNAKPPMRTIRASLAALDFDLGKALYDFIHSPIDPATKLKALELLARYTQVAPKADEGPGDTAFEVDGSDDDLLEALDANVHSIKS